MGPGHRSRSIAPSGTYGPSVEASVSSVRERPSEDRSPGPSLPLVRTVGFVLASLSCFGAAGARAQVIEPNGTAVPQPSPSFESSLQSYFDGRMPPEKIDAVAAATAALALIPGGLGLVLPAAAALLVAAGVAAWLSRRLGGLTGDVYGAAIELAELTVLIGARAS